MNGMPVVISEGEDENELLVVEIQINKKKVRLITGYGPQEKSEEAVINEFY